MTSPRSRLLPLCLCLLAALSACSALRPEERPGVAAAEEALRNGSPALAAQIAKGILARNPDDVAGLLMQGDAETQLGQFTEATASFQHALRLSPNAMRAKLGLGRLRLASDAVEAAALFEDATKQEPRNVAAWSNLGIARDGRAGGRSDPNPPPRSFAARSAANPRSHSESADERFLATARRVVCSRRKPI